MIRPMLPVCSRHSQRLLVKPPPRFHFKHTVLPDIGAIAGDRENKSRGLSDWFWLRFLGRGMHGGGSEVKCGPSPAIRTAIHSSVVTGSTSDRIAQMRLFKSLQFISRNAPPAAYPNRSDTAGCAQRPNRFWRKLKLRCSFFGRQKVR